MTFAAFNAALRARLDLAGPDALLDHELIQYTLTLLTPHNEVAPMADALLERFGGIGGLFSADADAIARQPGMNTTGAAAIKIIQAMHLRVLKAKVTDSPILLKWDAVLKYLQVDMGSLGVERVRVLHLNSRGVLIRDQHMGDGSVTEAPIYIREVVRKALDIGTTSIIMVHNHPGGDATPSVQDIEVTRKMISACKVFDIAVFDHLIVAGDMFSSFRTLGLM